MASSGSSLYQSRPLSRERFDDQRLRLISTPLLSPLFVKASGLAAPLAWSDPRIILGNLYTAAIIYAIWALLARIGFVMHTSEFWLRHPYRLYLTWIAASTSFTAAVAYCSAAIASSIFTVQMDWPGAERVAILGAITLTVLVQFYTGLYTRADMGFAKRRLQHLRQRENRAQLSLMVFEQEPESLLGTMRALRALISVDRSAAVRCAEDLAAVHRYILGEGHKALVMLREELELLSPHARVLQARFGIALPLDIAIADDLLDRYLIVPATLHLLLENALRYRHIHGLHYAPIRVALQTGTASLLLSYPTAPQPLCVHENHFREGLRARMQAIIGEDLTINYSTRHCTISIPLLPVPP